jgi:DNA replication and repair protein RecF
VILEQLHILNYRNIREASLVFAPKMNCLVGLNGQGKTNVLDAIYLLSFAKSSHTNQDSQNITHEQDMSMVQGVYKEQRDEGDNAEGFTISCGIRRGVKKQFKRDKKDYKRLVDHIGLIPLVLVNPSDQHLIEEGSDERRRFMDAVISQLDKHYLDCLTQYNALLKQRNALLKQAADTDTQPDDLLEVIEWQMIPLAEYIFKARTLFFEQFNPYFQSVYQQISGENGEKCSIRYISQLQDRDLREAYIRTRQRDIILGWTSQGPHKDDLDMRLGEHPLKQVGSQGQQRTFVLAMKLAQALYIAAQGSKEKPILLLDDIFDRLDSTRVERIVNMVQSPDFGQIFITDTDRQHLTDIVRPSESAKIFHVSEGTITLNNETC